MTFEKAHQRLQAIKQLLESGETLTLMQIQDLQKEAEECYALCQQLLKTSSTSEEV